MHYFLLILFSVSLFFIGGCIRSKNEGDFLIIGDSIPDKRLYPKSSCALLHQTQDRAQVKQICSGTLISPIKLLTAAHCVRAIEGSLKVFFKCEGGFQGSVNTTLLNDMHPSYDKTGKAHDLGVLSLMNTSGSAKPSQIVVEENQAKDLLKSAARGSERCAAFGWGTDNSGQNGKHLGAWVAYADLNFQLASGTLIVRDEKSLIQGGDSGGGLYCRSSTQAPWELIAVLSDRSGDNTWWYLAQLLYASKPWALSRLQ